MLCRSPYLLASSHISTTLRFIGAKCAAQTKGCIKFEQERPGTSQLVVIQMQDDELKSTEMCRRNIQVEKNSRLMSVNGRTLKDNLLNRRRCLGRGAEKGRSGTMTQAAARPKGDNFFA